MSFHEAAVEAMRNQTPRDACLMPEQTLAALARSEAVRAGIADSLHGFNSLGECECGFPTERNPEVMRQHQAEVILAALLSSDRDA